MPGAHEFDTEWGVDGNSPAERLADGRLLIFNSWQYPWRSVGIDMFQMLRSERVTIFNTAAIPGSLWLEATYRDYDGTLFGWYHNEIDPGCPERDWLRVPQIRQMVSRDNGYTWEDQGVVLAASGDSFQCDSENYYFAGGHGDFSVIFQPVTGYFYFYFTTYHRDHAEQGLAVARLAYRDRFEPVGKVWKWDGAGWDEPGVEGRAAAFFQPASDWHQLNPDAYWGPAIHYNTALRQYVMLLNRAVDEQWGTEGFYLSFNPNISNPLGWSTPQRLPLEVNNSFQAYPQVFGLGADGTDKLAGAVARLFLSGQSDWEIVFGEALIKPVRETGGRGSSPRRTR
jgi:hypothetical protein